MSRGEQDVHRMTDGSLTEETLTMGKAARHNLPQVLNLGIPGHNPSVLPGSRSLCGSLNLMRRKPPD